MTAAVGSVLPPLYAIDLCDGVLDPAALQSPIELLAVILNCHSTSDRSAEDGTGGFILGQAVNDGLDLRGDGNHPVFTGFGLGTAGQRFLFPVVIGDIQFQQFRGPEAEVALCHNVICMAMANLKEQKQARERIFQFVQKVDQDLATISRMEDGAEILTEYERTLDLSTAISAVQNRKRAKAIMENNQEKWAQTQASRGQNAQYIAANAPEAVRVVLQPQEKKYRATFTVTATTPMLRGLKSFLEGNNYEYQEVNE